MSKRLSKLAEFVRSDRTRRNNMTQGEYEQLLKAPKNYVSRVETGTITTPNLPFLKALGELTKRSIDQLQSWADLPAEGVVPLSLACGHVLWGASIVLAAKRGIDAIRCFTFEACDKKGGEFRPAFISPYADAAESGDDPDTDDCDVPGPTWDESPHNALLRPLSAADVLEKLEREEIDIAVVPGPLLKSHPSFLSVARIVDSPCCASLVCGEDMARHFFDSSQQPEPPGCATDGDAYADIHIHPIGSMELGSLIQNCKKTNIPLKIAAEPDTIGMVCLRDAAQYAFPKRTRIEQESLMEPFLLRSRARDLSEHGFDSLFASHRVSNDTFRGIITWEPQANWLLRSLRKNHTEKLYSIPLYLSFGAEASPEPLTFDIVIRRLDSTNARLNRAISELVPKLWSATLTLKAIQRGEFTRDFAHIARYFNLAQVENGCFSGSSLEKDILRVVEALNSVRFVTYLNFEESRELIGVPVHDESTIGTSNEPQLKIAASRFR